MSWCYVASSNDAQAALRAIGRKARALRRLAKRTPYAGEQQLALEKARHLERIYDSKHREFSLAVDKKAALGIVVPDESSANMQALAEIHRLMARTQNLARRLELAFIRLMPKDKCLPQPEPTAAEKAKPTYKPRDPKPRQQPSWMAALGLEK